jgi:hypothetical protein
VSWLSEPGGDPARRRLERDIQSADFDSGARAGLWRLVALQWPRLIVAVTAGDSHQLGMQIAVDGYAGLAPGGKLWDLESDTPLPFSRWPVGGYTAQVFRRDWPNADSPAPYMACDRAGLAGHPGWATEHPARAWHPGRTIAFYLRQIHHELRAAALPQPQARSAG